MNKKNFAGELGIDFDDIKDNLNEFDKEMIDAIIGVITLNSDNTC